MGILIDHEIISGPTHTEEVLIEKDSNKKKKRRSRKSKLNNPLSACSSMSELCEDDPELYEGETSSNHAVVSSELSTDVNLQNEQSPPREINEVVGSNPDRQPSVGEDPIGPVFVARQVDFPVRRKFFPPYWSAEAVSKRLEKGELLRAVFRVNAHNRLEAYCKIDGVQTDVLINGAVAQNRAVEGDTVAIVIDPPSLWQKMKGHIETPVKSPDGGTYENGSSSRSISDNSHVNGVLDYGYSNGYQPNDAYDSVISLEKLCILTSSLPSKRPTGSVVAVVERSRRRDCIVGFLSVKQWIYSRESRKKNSRKNKNHSDLNCGYVMLTPTDPKFTKMTIHVINLPESIKKRLEACDLTIETELVAAKIVDWAEESYIPEAYVTEGFGRGSDIEAQIAAILFQNAIDSSEFSSEVLSCLPNIPWEIPQAELMTRRDLRNLCIFTIDPSTASDLDDALSVEKLPNGVFRVGVHIADVSYFVLPDTAVDIDAQIRSTAVYLLRRKLPMLPPILSDNLASLNPGVDRLAFTIFFDINTSGEVLDRWIGRTIIQSCSKLSYEHAQDIIDGTSYVQDTSDIGKSWPLLHGPSEWSDVIKSVKTLHELSKILRKNRFKGGALSLESPKVAFLFDEEGVPYDSVISGRKDSNLLVEEFMLLANSTAAEVITRAYPSCALLRRHPEPNPRKLREFEGFCAKHGLKLDISSSASLHSSLELIKKDLKNDSILFDILMSYAARPMQLATFFCTGDSKDNNTNYSHYALAVPLYTHFTSPLRRYPDLMVHRTLAAAIEAECIYLKGSRMLSKGETKKRCITGLGIDKDEVESVEVQEALLVAASKHRVPRTETLADLAVHCNEKKLATRHVKDATDKLYMWVLLKKKEILYSKARVLGIGPKFMSIYIPKLAIERRIYYDEVEGLTSEWLDTTSTLILSQSIHRRTTRKSSPGRFKTLEEVVLVVSPAETDLEMNLNVNCAEENGENCESAFFPLVVHLLSTVPVAIHAVGGDDGPLDIVARLYISSYFN